jgi:hypothetical protein
MTDWGEFCNTPQDTGNYCAPEAKVKDGIADTETVFVRTDCVTRMPLPADEQDPIFQQHPELLLDRGTVANMITGFLVSAAKGGQTQGTALDPNGGQGGG